MERELTIRCGETTRKRGATIKPELAMIIWLEAMIWEREPTITSGGATIKPGLAMIIWLGTMISGAEATIRAG
ncbi:hypothetical protein [Thalassobacillus sp. CUG 92003]|uniref:hypothetical protein n=1 Tax=Thalassobacillus sp. CUG 92003 TaxID=2736641 RepID=UPI0015E70F90|nr:hypothetical protein [Thalassobacillus sp. CUG 92003]